MSSARAVSWVSRSGRARSGSQASIRTNRSSGPDDPSYAVYQSQNGPVVFYTELSNGSGARCSSAHGPESSSDRLWRGQLRRAWSSALRDDKNRVHAYDVTDRYTDAGEVTQSNVQITHASLGPENQLYYTFSVSGPDSNRSTAAIDTTTMTESCIDDTKLSSTQALVDERGDYYPRRGH
jgi:hypothetical protein